MTKPTLKDFAAELTAAIASNQKVLDTFKERLADNPVYAFKWSDGAMQAAAKMQVYERFLIACEKDLSEVTDIETEEQRVEQLRTYITTEAFRMAEQVPSSTSRASNAMENFERQAYIKLAKFFEGIGYFSL
jgi:hypothetical protein